MRLVTFSTPPHAIPRAGVRVGHRVLDIEAASRVDGQPLPSSMKALLRAGRGAFSRVQALAKAAQTRPGRFSSAMSEEGAIRFLPPVPDPDKFLCVGPEEATGIVKPGASLVGHNTKVARPAGVTRFDCEPELVFVIGRRASGVKSEDIEIEDYVVGVTLLNDLTDRDMHKREAAAPAFGPLGPEIVTLDEIGDPYDLWLTCSVNGEERMRVSTADHAWRIGEILEHYSRIDPVEPGDMFSTAAPGDAAGKGKGNGEFLFLKPGDVVECSIEGITTLRTTIVAP